MIPQSDDHLKLHHHQWSSPGSEHSEGFKLMNWTGPDSSDWTGLDRTELVRLVGTGLDWTWEPRLEQLTQMETSEEA